MQKRKKKQIFHKEKDFIKKYCPVSLLPIFGKKLERLIFNSLFEYIDEIELSNPNHSGFRSFDSCLNQLILKP